MSGCSAFLQAFVGAASATSSYYSYQTAKKEAVEVTTISKDCHLASYVQVDCEHREELKQTEDGYALLKRIANNNKLLVQNCPNIDKPEPVECP